MKTHSVRIYFICFLLLLYFPYLLLFTRYQVDVVPFKSFLKIFSYSFLQATLSTLLTVLVSIWGAFGIFWLYKKLPPAMWWGAQIFIFLPTLLPSLFVIVSVLTPWHQFPFGIVGVVLLHVFSEVGVVSWILYRLISVRLKEYADWSCVVGVSLPRFFWTTFSLIKKDLLQTSLILMIYFLTSFSIPLIVGNQSLAGLEVVIYKKIFVSHEPQQALFLFLFESLFIVLLTTLIYRLKNPPHFIQVQSYSRYFEKKSGVLPVIFPSCLLILSFFMSVPKGWIQLQHSGILEHLNFYTMGSLLIGLLVGGFVFANLLLIIYFLQFFKTQSYFSLMATPSFVVLAWACRPFFPMGAWWSPILISWAITIAFLPALVRFGVLQKMDSLRPQIEMAQWLGASPFYTFRRVTAPQLIPMVSSLSGLAAVWAIGDFSLSRVVLDEDQTLAMAVQSLMENYRWESAQLLSGWILFCALIVFSFFAGVSYVGHKKLI